MFNFDSAIKNQFLFQYSVTSSKQRIIDLHNEIMVFLIFIFFLVTWMLVRSNYLFREKNTKELRFAFQHNSTSEWIWTVVSALILLWIALPSCALLYLSEKISSPAKTIKITSYVKLLLVFY